MIKVIAVGKVKEAFLRDGIDEFSKRINGFEKFSIVEVKEYNQKTIKQNISDEGNAILEQINEKDFVITLEIKGIKLDSIELAKKIEEIKNYQATSIVFVIGGSNGLSDEVIKRSNYHLSFSKFTFPHQLMRLVLTEQIYRALTIINHKEYHK